MNLIFTVMKYKELLIILVVLLSACSQGISQHKKRQIKTYTSADGITEVVGSYIMKDSLGYIWTYGSNTAHRFDGYRFKNYYPAVQKDGRKTNLHIHRMYCSPDNDRVICGNLGAYLYDPSVDQFVSISDSFPTHPKQFLPELTAAAKVGDRLYFTSFVGLHSYDMTKKQWEYHDITPEKEHKNNHHSKKAFWSLAIDKYDPAKLIMFGRSTYAKFDTENQSVVECKTYPLEDKYPISIHNFVQTGPDRFLLSSYGRGIIKYDAKTNTAGILYNESSVGFEGTPFRISHSSCLVGNEIVSTSFNDFMTFVDTLTGKARDYETMTPYSFDYTTFGDSIYWGTTIKGLLKIQSSLDTRYPIKLPNQDLISKIVFSNDGKKVIILAKTETLYNYDLATNKIRPFPMEKKAIRVYHDSHLDEFLLQTSPTNLDVLATNNFSSKRQIALQSAKPIYDLIITSDFYIINQDNAITWYEKQTGSIKNTIPVPEKYYAFSGLKRLKINLINDSLVILQNPEYTISINSKTKELKEHSEIRHIGANQCYSMDGTNFYMAIERSGIAKFHYDADTKTFSSQPLPYTQDIYYNLNSNLQNDSLIWLICRDHVRVFNMKSEAYDLVHYISLIPRNLTQYTAFTEHDALLYSEQTLYKVPLKRPPAKIESINLEYVSDGKKQIVGASYLEFPPNQTALEITWTAPCQNSHEPLTFFTNLEGRDDEWEANDRKTSKLYLGLAPGKYAFHVKAMASGGPIVKEQLVAFEILQPWYLASWFIILAALTVFLLGYLIYKYRVRTITEKTKLDKHIAELELKALRAQLNPHFIFNSLNSIKRLIQINDNETAIEYLLLFSSMIRNVLDLSDKKAITLREELEFSSKYLKMEKMRFDKNFDFVVQVENDEILDNYSIPSMILQPHLENAIWHGIMPLRETKGKLYLDILENEDSLIIRIEDNGIGRAASKVLSENNKGHIHKSKGQSLSIDRLKLSALAREQEISTEIIDKDPAGPNPGTIIKIKLKKSND